MTWICEKCGVENKPKFKFCVACGLSRPVEVPLPADTADRPVIVAKAESAAPAVSKPAPARKPIEREPVPVAAPPTLTEESGWRCHECWKLNPLDVDQCTECGTNHRASDRADSLDRVFGVFGKLGKWPLVILFVIAVGAGVAWLFYYLNPKHGEIIEAPAGLEAEIKASLDEVTKRLPEQANYYNCYSTNVAGRTESGGYAALVRLVPRSANVANRPADQTADQDRFWQFIAHRDGYKWKVERFPIPSFESVTDPCTRH